ncbi:MAG: TetR/AcrR family transcriptional regulator [Acidimicrobiales bacterium]
MRADALRNRRRILEAAEDTFARDGLSVPVDVVAERAGLGVGTLYRHFPTKEALFEAIVVARMDELIEACDAGGDAEPGAAFFSFLAKLADEVSRKHDLFDAMAAAGFDYKPRCADRVECLKQGIERLRRLAAASGEVRSDVTSEQIMQLVVGSCVGHGPAPADSAACHRMLEVIFDGLRAHPAPRRSRARAAR